MEKQHPQLHNLRYASGAEQGSHKPIYLLMVSDQQPAGLEWKLNDIKQLGLLISTGEDTMSGTFFMDSNQTLCFKFRGKDNNEYLSKIYEVLGEEPLPESMLFDKTPKEIYSEVSQSDKWSIASLKLVG